MSSSDLAQLHVLLQLRNISGEGLLSRQYNRLRTLSESKWSGQKALFLDVKRSFFGNCSCGDRALGIAREILKGKSSQMAVLVQDHRSEGFSRFAGEFWRAGNNVKSLGAFPITLRLLFIPLPAASGPVPVTETYISSFADTIHTAADNFMTKSHRFGISKDYIGLATIQHNFQGLGFLPQKL